MNELALFAGAGGGILGGKLLGWRTVCAVEWEPYAASVLAARQNDKVLPPFPIWDDVQTFDGKPWRGIVDVVSGGFPCQDISAAGKGAGIDGERSGMWREMARIIREVRPKFVFVENSPMLTSRGLGVVLGDLAELGFNAQWGVLGAADVGANHQRDRIWIVARSMGNSNNDGQIAAEVGNGINEGSDNGSSWQKQTSQPSGSGQQYAQMADSDCFSSKIRRNDFADAENGGKRNDYDRRSGGNDRGKSYSEKDGQMVNSTVAGLERHRNNTRQQKVSEFGDASWWETEPNVGRVADGLAARVDRLKAIGNGQVPLCAATAWRILSERVF